MGTRGVGRADASGAGRRRKEGRPAATTRRSPRIAAADQVNTKAAPPTGASKPIRASSRHVGHGGVIDVLTYSAPDVLRTAHMEDYFGYLVQRVHAKVGAAFQRALGDEDITPARFTALSIVAANPGVRQVDIARALSIARPAALKVVNQLLDLGLVDCHPIPSDKRIGAFAITKVGRNKLRSYERKVHALEKRVCKNLSTSEQAQVDALLRKLLGL